MTFKGLLRVGAASVVATGLALGSGGGYAPVAAADYTRYHTYDELTAALRELTKTHANLARLVEVARTREGRTVWAIEIGNPAGTPLAERPALLIAANLEGDQVVGSELALFVAEALLTGYAGTPATKARLDANVFYILPRVNPDAAELMFAPLKTGRKTNATKFDNDNDGRLDEDGPEDLNKDGVISLMRVKDPLGPYMINPEDPRLMRRADAQKGERGGYAIYWEGIDNDGDGFYNEDPAGGSDINRNFQHQYPYFQPDAGPHMTSEAETRGAARLRARPAQHRRRAHVWRERQADRAAHPHRRPRTSVDHRPRRLRQPEPRRRARRRPLPDAAPLRRARRPGGGGDDEDGAGRGGRGAAGGGRGGPTPPATSVNTADVEDFRTISDKYRQLTGVRSAPATRLPAGALFEDAYFQFGVPAFSTPGWGIPEPAGGGRGAAAGAAGGEGRAGGPGGRRGGAPAGDAAGGPAEASGTAAFDRRFVRWLDTEKIDGFTPWQPFKHPSLGDVEIGGFRPFAHQQPSGGALAELGEPHAGFSSSSRRSSRASRSRSSVTAWAAGCIASGPRSRTAAAGRRHCAGGAAPRGEADAGAVDVDPAAIVSGAPKTSSSRRSPARGAADLEWIVRGEPGSTVAWVVAQKGGTATQALRLE